MYNNTVRTSCVCMFFYLEALQTEFYFKVKVSHTAYYLVNVILSKTHITNIIYNLKRGFTGL